MQGTGPSGPGQPISIPFAERGAAAFLFPYSPKGARPPRARKPKTAQRSLRSGSLPITANDLSRFPPALATPRSRRGPGVQQQLHPTSNTDEDDMSTKASHTRGPWAYELDINDNFLVRADNGAEVCSVSNNPDEHDPELEANARLIAEAPDLLAAAKLVLERWCEGDLAEAVRELDNAVSNAEG